MPRGPLPDPNAVRRNKPTIPTTALPAGGFQGGAPELPSWLELGAAGRAWWAWAWTTPQAAGWGGGHEVMIARRASLEDDLAAIAKIDSLDAFDMLDVLEDSDRRTFRDLVQRLASLATGRLAICREIRELEDRLGLTPKGLANLRWSIVDDGAAKPGASPPQQTGRRAALRVVDAAG